MRNRDISDTYEPGSVFKTIVVSAALEEVLWTSIQHIPAPAVFRLRIIIRSGWKPGGHGTENLTQGLMNSCNPFFVTIGQKLGKDTFYKYFEAFGFTEKTGIDLPAERLP